MVVGGSMKKVTILALHLGYGGIERMITNLANGIVDEYEVTIVSTYQIFEEPFFKLDPRITVTYLLPHTKPNREEVKKNIHHPWILMKELWKGIQILRKKKQTMIAYLKKCDCDIIISTRDIHNLWLGKYGPKNALKIGSEHNHHNNQKKYIKKIVKSVQKLDYFVLVSKELQQFYAEQLKRSSCQCFYIPNSLDELPPKISPLREFEFLSVGRLAKEKGYHDLLEVMSLLKEDLPKFHLTIIGGGVEEQTLRLQIKNLGLEAYVTLTGFQPKEVINTYLARSSLFLMSSYTESFGIVLLEAFSYGIPCIAFDSAQGAKEIIQDKMNGYLIPNRNLEEMKKRILELAQNENKRKVMGLSARRVAEQYEYHIVAKEWKDLFEKET